MRAFAFLAATACSLLLIQPENVRGAPAKGSIRVDVPFKPQTEPTLCGVASLEMVTAYYKTPPKTGAITRLTYEARSTGGVSGASLKSALEEAGYFVAVFGGSLDHQESGLYHQLDRHRPPIVMTGRNPRHYSVVIGYDENAKVLVLLDPAQGRVVLPINRFMAIWKDANRFTLLALPKAPSTGSGMR